MADVPKIVEEKSDQDGGEDKVDPIKQVFINY